MPILTLRIPEQEHPVCIPLPRGEAVLVGRRPDPEQLGALLTPAERERLASVRLRCVPIDSPLVSASHLLVLNEGGALRCRDLRSRNGSWLRLDAAAWHELGPQAQVIDVVLTSSWATERPAAIPAAAWKQPEEFAASLRDAIDRWLSAHSIAARVEVINLDTNALNTAWTLPLPEGKQLAVRLPQETTHERSWQAMQSEIASFIHEENRRFAQLTEHEDGLLFTAPAIRAAHGRVADAASAGMRLVLLGPTGSGKEILARCYHRHSPRAQGPFVAVNCALLRGDLLYAQLFGARRGSFTGAIADLPGLVESAQAGTLFLDEIGELDGETQRALLRFLDSRGEYQRLGDPKPRRVDAQLVCATHVDLSNPEICQARFREDLWYRIAVRVVHVPPLRERPEDILAYLRRHRLRGTQLAVSDALTAGALERVLRDPWPGNFRDLENFVSRLPSAIRAHSLDVLVVERAIVEGRSGRAATPRGEPATLRESSRKVVMPLGEAGWDEISAQASRAFCQDFGGPPRGWGQMQTFTDRYLKPVFVAQSAGLAGQPALPEHINYSELARRLSVADGGTIKSHLLRYFERFAAESASSQSETRVAALRHE